MKDMYVTQPYRVGSKIAKSKSIALVIPHELVKKHRIDTSTVIILRTDSVKKIITLHPIEEENASEQGENMVPADESFEASKQQESLKVQ